MQKVVLATHGVGPSNQAIESEVAQRFEKERGVKVEVVILPPAEYDSKIVSMILGGNPPDVIYSAARNIGAFLSAGIVQPLNPFLDRDPDFRLQDFFPTIVNAFTFDGRIYGIPRGNQPTVVYVNRTALTDAGLGTPPVDWQWEGAFLDIARRLTRDVNGDGVPDVYGLHDGGNWWWGVVWSYGGSFLDATEKRYTLGSPAGVAALRFVASLSQQHRVAPGPQGTIGSVLDAFVNGKAVMMMNNAVVSAQPSLRQASFQWEVVEVPAGPVGRATTLDGAGYSLVAQARNPQLGWELIKALSSEQGNASLTRAFLPGQVLPSRRSVALGKDFLLAPPPPSDRMPFVRALAYARTPFVGKEKWPELSRILDQQAIQPLLRGEVEARVALERIGPAIEAVLAH